jgi:hypothetical protein
MYFVRYVQGCSPEIKQFKTKEQAAKFVANFMLKYQFGNTDDNWIDCVYEGKHIYLDPSVSVDGVKNVTTR